MSIILSEPTHHRIVSISQYLQKMRDYFKIGTSFDILDLIDSDSEDNECTESQIIERQKRAACNKHLIASFRNNTLPPIEHFHVESFFKDILSSF
jgi:hypothetical protein